MREGNWGDHVSIPWPPLWPAHDVQQRPTYALYRQGGLTRAPVHPPVHFQTTAAKREPVREGGGTPPSLMLLLLHTRCGTALLPPLVPSVGTAYAARFLRPPPHSSVLPSCCHGNRGAHTLRSTRWSAFLSSDGDCSRCSHNPLLHFSFLCPLTEVFLPCPHTSSSKTLRFPSRPKGYHEAWRGASWWLEAHLWLCSTCKGHGG